MLLLLLSTAALVTADASIGIMPEESVSATLNEVTKLLEKGKADSGLILSATFADAMNQKLIKFAENMRHLESLKDRLSEKESKINSILHTANTREMENLVDRLELTLEREIELRDLEDEVQEEQRTRQERKRIKNSQSYNQSATDDIIEIISTNLAERLDTDVVMEESEEEMKKWILTLIEEELGIYKKDIFDLASQVDTSNKSSNSDSHDTKTTECPSLTKIVQKVQQALNDHAEDGIGRVDHAQGASVVHWLTSETHSQSAVPSGTLGSVWWNKFIPQDWERLLPYGWEKWEVGIPSYVYHSLGFLSGDMAPPETVLQKNTLPGSCWPMEGSSGQIVLKLAYPIVVESLSIDHVSSNIIAEGKYNSAPKHLKIIGYPSCNEMESNCGAAGFDLSDPIDIADIEYDAEGRSVQTFESHYTKAMASIPTPTFDTDDTESGSCSVQASCSTPPRISVAAIDVKVLKNWGNPDFTCLYRLRVHGDPEKMREIL